MSGSWIAGVMLLMPGMLQEMGSDLSVGHGISLYGWDSWGSSWLVWDPELFGAWPGEPPSQTHIFFWQIILYGQP